MIRTLCWPLAVFALLVPGLCTATLSVAFAQVQPSIVWENRFANPDKSTSVARDHARALAVDQAGHVFVTGDTRGASIGTSFATIEYDEQGVVQSVAYYEGERNRENTPVAIAVDPEGEVIVTGWGWVDLTDFVTVKYDTTGAERWIARYNSPDSYMDRASAMALDSAGNVYVTGYGHVQQAAREFVTVKYTAQGEEAWVARPNGSDPTAAGSYPTAIALDQSGNVYVAGQGSGIMLHKYSPQGQLQWARNAEGFIGDPYRSVNQDFYSYGTTPLVVDQEGNFIVLGTTCEDLRYCFHDTYLILKYDPEGTLLWSKQHDLSTNQDIPAAIAVDPSNNLYVAGSGNGIALVKYGPDGTVGWVTQYDDAFKAYNIALDSDRNIYVLGRDAEGAVILKYSPGGVLQWQIHYKGDVYDRFGPEAFAVDNAGFVYLTGTATGIDDDSGLAPNSEVFVTAKFTQVSGAPVASFEHRSTRLYPNYPNPFATNTTIAYELAEPAYVRLCVYDLLGRRVADLVEGYRAAGRHEATWNASDLASGLYICRMTSGGATGIVSLVLQQ